MIINDAGLNALMNETIRPKCKPSISVGMFVDGNSDSIESIRRSWNEDTILNLTYKRGVDPIGRTLPYMELVWSESNDREQRNSEGMARPEEFEALSKVSFSYTQYMDFSGENKKTISTHPLWLVGPPVVNGNEVVWTARDMMYFLNNKQQIGFQSGLNFGNPMRYFLLDERAEHKSKPYDFEFVNYLQQTQRRTQLSLENVIDTAVVYEGTSKNLLKDIASTRNYFWDFHISREGMELKSLSDLLNQTKVVHTFKGDVMKKFPDLQKNSNISAFSFSKNRVKIKTDEAYKITTPSAVEEEMGASVNRYDLDDWGTVTEHSGGYVANTINKVVYTTSTTNSITVAPVVITQEEVFVNNNKVGELYSENNSCFFDESNTTMTPRMELLNKYFNENVYTMQFEGLPHFAIEPCDLVGVETNITENGERVIKKGVVIEQELAYNGCWVQKLIVHEVRADG